MPGCCRGMSQDRRGDVARDLSSTADTAAICPEIFPVPARASSSAAMLDA